MSAHCERELEGANGRKFTCGGKLETVESAGGGQIYGTVCRACGQLLAKCENCGKFVPDLQKHLTEKKREGMVWKPANPDCLKYSPLARHQMAVEAMAGKAGRL